MEENRKSRNEQMERFINALGTIAEMALIFYRNTIRAGASCEEALRLTQAFLAANIFYGGSDKHENP